MFVFPRVLPVDKEPLDLQPYFSAERAYQLIATFDDNLRQRYLVTEMTVDVIYPVVYTLLFSFIIMMLYGSVQLAKVPFLILIADLIENTGIVLMLKNYPEKLETLATITGVFTSLKWCMVLISVSIILFGAGRKLISSLSKK